MVYGISKTDPFHLLHGVVYEYAIFSLFSPYTSITWSSFKTLQSFFLPLLSSFFFQFNVECLISLKEWEERKKNGFFALRNTFRDYYYHCYCSTFNSSSAPFFLNFVCHMGPMPLDLFHKCDIWLSYVSIFGFLLIAVAVADQDYTVRTFAFTMFTLRPVFRFVCYAPKPKPKPPTRVLV